ncbi:hypothetical protein AB6A40_004170 [Gnathostoma spinigerum]|uniref:Uncharacterized protein n=1 Tax=Gnathostoma spinigerum TaxID=75299 RepID=A0ABD6EE15_9BILA
MLNNTTKDVRSKVVRVRDINLGCLHFHTNTSSPPIQQQLPHNRYSHFHSFPFIELSHSRRSSSSSSLSSSLSSSSSSSPLSTTPSAASSQRDVSTLVATPPLSSHSSSLFLSPTIQFHLSSPFLPLTSNLQRTATYDLQR